MDLLEEILIQEQKISVGTRLGSMLLDHVIMTCIMMLFFIPTMVPIISENIKASHNGPLPNSGSWELFLMNFGFSLYFCKDVFNGRSIAKRIMKLQVVDNLSGKPASPLQCLVRDLFCILWPIEGIISISNTSRRIGDRVAGTKLVVFNGNLEQPKLNTLQIIFSLVIACSFSFLLTMLAR